MNIEKISRQQSFGKSILNAVFILVLGGGVGITYHLVSSTGTSFDFIHQHSAVEYEQTYRPEDLKISLTAVKEAFSLQNAVFIDSRSLEEYKRERIPDAIHIIPNQATNDIQDILAHVGSDKLIIVYCAGGDCQSSISLSERLRNLGYVNAFAFYGGWRMWKAIQYPTQH